MRSSDTGVVWLAVAASVLAGCGGGGGGSGNTPPVNAAPTIQNQTYSGTEDVTLAGQIVASDPGDTLSFSIVTNPAHGTLGGSLASGQFSYAPAANFNGEDAFRVRVADSRNQTAIATIRLVLAPVNDPPSAANDVIKVETTGAVAVLTNDSDVDGDALTVAIRGTPLVGTATVNGDGTVAIALPPGFKGFTKFDYRITDAAGITADATTQVFVGIEPFSVFYYGVPPGGGDTGIYLDDLFTSRPVHPPVMAATFESLAVSADGSALVYVLRLSNEFQVWYVDIGNLGVQRPAATLSSAQTVDTVAISHDGRYAATVLRTAASPADIREVQLFDADNAAPPSRVSLDPAIHLASYEPKFNAAGTALYYIANVAFPGESAVYKVTLSTRAVARATPILPAAVGASYVAFWVSPDESRILHFRSLDATARQLSVTPGGQPDVQALLHEPSFAEPFYPSIAPDFDTVAVPQLHGPDADRLKLAHMSSPGTTVAAGPEEFVRNIEPTTVPENVRWRHDSGAFLTCSWAQSALCRVYEASLSDLDHPQVVNGPIAAQESATNGAYSSDGERVSYWVSGPMKQELHVTTRASMGAASTLVSPASEYLISSMLDPSGRVAVYMTAASAGMTLVNLDVPEATVRIADESPGIIGLNVIARRWVPVFGFSPLPGIADSSAVAVAPTPARRGSAETFQGTQPTILPAVLPVTLPGDPPGGNT